MTDPSPCRDCGKPTLPGKKQRMYCEACRVSRRRMAWRKARRKNYQMIRAAKAKEQRHCTACGGGLSSEPRMARMCAPCAAASRAAAVERAWRKQNEARRKT